MSVLVFCTIVVVVVVVVLGKSIKNQYSTSLHDQSRASRHDQSRAFYTSLYDDNRACYNSFHNQTTSHLKIPSRAFFNSYRGLKRFGTDTTSVTTVWFTLHRYSFCCIWRAQPNTHINAWDDNTNHIC